MCHIDHIRGPRHFNHIINHTKDTGSCLSSGYKLSATLQVPSKLAFNFYPFSRQKKKVYRHSPSIEPDEPNYLYPPPEILVVNHWRRKVIGSQLAEPCSETRLYTNSQGRSPHVKVLTAEIPFPKINFTWVVPK